MFLRVLAFAALLCASTRTQGQEAFADGLLARARPGAKPIPANSAWLDLRQNAAVNSKPQDAPAWVESVNLVPVAASAGSPARTVFRIRVTRPRADLQMMLVRLFFDDKPGQRPLIIAWDESGTQVLRSRELGAGIDLPSSDTVILPMISVSCIDVEVPGDGASVRGVFMDWMTSRNTAHPLSAASADVIPEPFSAVAPLHAPAQDTETFGTVTATLSQETIRVGASVQAGAAFQFGLETQPLLALITFEVSTARIDSPPQIFLNGENLGAVTLTLPELADPGYRGEMERLVNPMRFHYTGWLRAQKLVPAANLRVGTNELVVIGGAGTPASAIRATQIQLKYLWDKSDYLLQTDR
ncbi:MAG: hypothetical protein ACR2HH_06500 [Chthoniobacterales bacterium]